ncbi:hypothetical protein ZWY2020_024490 [Hordeum vulgare]|nr:hypothetical protein ZWY2020_024490 [Hordeum vulgare]
MGKKESGSGGDTEKVVEVAARPREFALKVTMHCRCQGCTDRLRTAVQDLTLAPGVEATCKKVDLVFSPEKERKNEEGEHARAIDAASVQALIADL